MNKNNKFQRSAISILLTFTMVISLTVFAMTAVPIAVVAVEPELVTDDAYLSHFFVRQTLDGTGAFDEDMDPNSPYYYNKTGNDSSSSNKIVRSFDSITYEIIYATKVYSEEEDVFYEKGVIEFEFLLPLTSQEAQWNLSVMGWMDAGYTLKTESRTYDFNGNDIVEEDEKNVSCQVLKGQRTFVASGGNPSAIPGQGNLIAVVDVLGMKNESVVRPVFTAWMQHNQAGTKKLKDIPATGNTVPCANENHNKILQSETDPVRTTEQVTVLSDKITVTAAPRYNVQLKASSTDYIRDTYNFDEGNELALDRYKGLVEGRVAGYGITLQLYNNKDRGLKGIELPQGPITFDIVLETSFIPSVPKAVLTDVQQAYVKENYKPLVLSYDEHRSSGVQQDERDLKYNGTSVGDAAPYNKGTSSSSCHNGGIWRATKDSVTGVISITVSDYVINPKHFPSSNAGGGSYYNPTTGIENIGCFSAGEFFVVTPFNNNGESDPLKRGTYVLDDLNNTFDLNIGDGTFDTIIRDTKLRATSITGQSLELVDDTSNQMREDDDAKNKGVYLAKNGSHGWISMWTLRIISLNDGFSDVLGRAHSVPGEWTNYGLDTLTRGSNVGVGVGYNNADNGDLENIAVAANLLGKFDADVVTLNGNASAIGVNEYGFKYQMLYGTKPDGSNWSSDDEMELMRIENLKYYASLADIPPGHKCVAVLAEIRPAGKVSDVVRVLGGNRVRIVMDGTVNRDFSLIGNVYQTVIGGEIWRRNQYNENIEIQSMLNKVPEPYNSALGARDPRPNVEQQPAVTEYRQYDKVVYNDNGTTTGHTGNYNYGDSLRIVDTTTSISKHIAQKNADKEKNIYQLDTEQRYVDFVLTPKFDPLPEDLSTTTTVTVIDTLPENVHYEEGSAYFGGTYVQNLEEGQPGTVVDGKIANPEVGKVIISGKEHITLKWVFVDADTRDTLPVIHFTAMIGNMSDQSKDVANNQEFINAATIESTDDRRPKAVSTGNLSQVGFAVSKMMASSLSKIADHPRYEVGDEMGFQVNVGNNAGTTQNNTLIVDTLPCNGDKKGSKFNGDIFITDLLIDAGAVTNLSGWRCFYTTSDGAVNTSAKDYKFSDVLGNVSIVNGEQVTWNEVIIGSDGTIPALKSKVNVRAIAFIGNLMGGKVFKMHMSLQTPQTNAESVIVNKISKIEDDELAIEESSQAKSRIVDRQISGLPWNDENQDGQRKGEKEVALQGIKVQLLKKDKDTGEYQEVKDIAGNSIFVETGSTKKTTIFKLTSVNNLGNTVEIDVAATANEDGTYLFSGLPEGTFGIRFGSGTTPIRWYTASPVNAGDDDYSDSDGKPILDEKGVLQYTQIEDIVLPKIEDLLTSVFVTGFHDSGFYMRKSDLIISKTVANGDKTKEFKFIVQLKDGKNQNIEGVYLYTGTAIGDVDVPDSGEIIFVDGEANITLKHGQSIVIAEIPIDTRYTVTEDTLDIGWTAEQQTISGFLEINQEVRFINSYAKEYTVKYNPGTHGIFAEKVVEGLFYGETTPEAPETLGEANWKFIGWSSVPEATVTGDAMYVALWVYVTPPELVDGKVTIRITKELVDENDMKVGKGKAFAIWLYDEQLNPLGRYAMKANIGEIIIDNLSSGTTYYLAEEWGSGYEIFGYSVSDFGSTTQSAVGFKIPLILGTDGIDIKITVRNKMLNLADIEDENLPFNPPIIPQNPPIIEIPYEEPLLTDNYPQTEDYPETGDENNMMACLIACGSFLAFNSLILSRRNKKYKNKLI